MTRVSLGPGLTGLDACMRKLKIPIFKGEDAHGWVYRVEQYFSIYGLTDREMLMAGAISLERRALMWYQWREHRWLISTWVEFKDHLLECFRDPKEGNLHEQFLLVVKEGLVMEYRDKFELLFGRLRGIPEEV